MPVEDRSNGNWQQAEHQRVLENMRKAGYSEARIQNSEGQYHQPLPPGTKTRTFAGITVVDDGSTPQQRLHNITHSGLLDTPISTDPHYYSRGEYGYYKTHGGTKGFGQWLDDGQK